MSEQNNNNIMKMEANACQQRPRRRRLCSVVPPQLKVEYTQEGRRTVVISEEEMQSNTEKPQVVVTDYTPCCESRIETHQNGKLMEEVLKRHYNTLQKQAELRRLDSSDLTSTVLPRHQSRSHHIDVISSGFLPAEQKNASMQSNNKPELAINLTAKTNKADCLLTRKTQRSMSAHSVALPGPDSSVLRDPETGKMYKRGKLLGKGGFARVYEGVDLETGKKYALKIIDKSRLSRPPQREKVDAEIELHAASSDVGHPNVAGFEVSFENSRIICLVLELCEKKSLAQYLRRKEFLSESEVSDLIWQIISGLSHIHGCGLLHRDLKLGNILLADDMTVKVGDFGLATRTCWGKRKTICGTPNFIAPEVLQRQGHGPESDIWAVGCILFTLLVGKPPFETTSLKDTYKCILKNSYRIPSTVSQEAADLVRWMLRSKPHARPTLHDITQHVFFVKNQTHLRYPSLETLAKEYPSKEVPIGKVLPLRRKSVLPRLQIQDESRSWMSDMYSSTRHNSCPTNPCSMYSSSQRTRPVPPSTSGPKISLVNHLKHVTSARDSTSCSNTQAEEEVVEDESNKDASVTPVSEVIPEREENNNTTTCSGNEETEEPKACDEQAKDAFVCNENSKNNAKTLLGKYKKNPLQKQVSGGLKSKTSSPVKLLASKLQKFKFPSPKRCIRAAANSMKTRTSENDSPIIPTNAPTPVNEYSQATWITKWVDYSNKYGFGYQLADGTICVLFNDGAHISLLPDAKTVEYSEPDWESSSKTCVFTLASPPAALLRPVKILQHFTMYMDKNLMHTAAVTPLPENNRVPRNSVRMLTWSRTADHVSMYLSNGTLQVNYSDHKKINVSNIHRKSALAVSYMDEKKVTSTFRGSDLSLIKDAEIREKLDNVHNEFHLLLGSEECIAHPFCGALKPSSAPAKQVQAPHEPVVLVA